MATRNRLATLPALRVFAFLLVFLDHSLMPFPGANPFADKGLGVRLESIFRVSAFGCVSFFFILSGFLLTWLAKPTDTYGAFLRRRLVRIYPGHLVTMVIALLGTGAALYQVIPNILLVQSWVPRITVWSALNGSTWSLDCEILFYLLFPLILRQVQRIRVERLWWWVGGIGGTALAVAAAGTWLVPTITKFSFESPVGMEQFWLVYTCPAVRMLDFVLGMIMCRIIQSGRWINVGLPTAVGIYAAMGFVGMHVPFLFSLVSMEIIPAALVVGAAASMDVRGRPSILRGRLFSRLGDLSYSFYLVHGLVVFGGGAVLRQDHLYAIPQAVGIIFADLAASLLLAWMLYHGVEKPIRDRWSKPRPKAIVPTPLPVPSGSMT